MVGVVILTAHANYVITSTAAASLFTILLITPSFLVTVLHDHIASNHGCVHSGCACCEQCCLNSYVARVPSEMRGHPMIASPVVMAASPVDPMISSSVFSYRACLHSCVDVACDRAATV